MRRQQSVGKEFEVIRLAEEGGEVGGQGVAEVLQLLGVAPLDEHQIGFEVAQLEGPQPAAEPLVHQCALGIG